MFRHLPKLCPRRQIDKEIPGNYNEETVYAGGKSAGKDTGMKYYYHCLTPVMWLGESLLEKVPGSDTLAVSRYRISSSTIPGRFEGFRFAVLSDLHGRWFGPAQEELLEKIASLSPTAVLMLGDWIRSDYEADDRLAVKALFEALAARYPVYGILGNHEGMASHQQDLIYEMQQLGVRILQDESLRVGPDGREWTAGAEDPAGSSFLWLTGMLATYENGFFRSARDSGIGPNLRQEYRSVMCCVREQMKQDGQSPFQIVMSHRPELFPLYAELSMPLVLCGHAHGGLLELPSGKRLYAPDQGFFPRYTHGVYRKGSTSMIVSEGLGGPRILIQPQILLLELSAKT